MTLGGLYWVEIVLDGRFITKLPLRYAFRGGPLRVTACFGKTGRLLVPQGVVDAIDEWRSTLVDHDVIPSADDPIICRQQTARFHGMEVVTPLTPVSSRTIFSAVEHWLDLIGITGARRGTHRLRRSAATIAWEGHADLASIQTMLGHENVNTTVRNYIRPSEDLLRPASDCIDIDP